MNSYSVTISSSAIKDIEDAMFYYEQKSPNLGIRFEDVIFNYTTVLESNPHFEVRYGEVRCIPVKEFPFMIHFTINEMKKRVEIRAVLHTSLKPNFIKTS